MRLLARRSLGSLWFGTLAGAPDDWHCLAFDSPGRMLRLTIVNSRSPGNGELAHLELLDLTGATPAPAEGMPGERPKPCSGALCSGNPAPPLSTMPSVPPLTGGQWALPVFLGSLVGSGVFQGLARRHRRWPRRSLLLDLPPPSFSGYLSHIPTT